MQNRSKGNRTSKGQGRKTGQPVRGTGQTGQTGRTIRAKTAAKAAKAPLEAVPVDSLSAGEAARELGISPRTVRRLCSEGRLPSFRTPGGQVRVWRKHLDSFRQGAPVTNGIASVALENKRESLQTLNLELQERRLRRELKRLKDEEVEDEQDRAASIEAEEQRNRSALEEARLQREDRAAKRIREEEQLEAECQRQQWIDSWVEYSIRSIPQGVPREVASDVREAVEEALTIIEPSRSQSIVQHLVAGAIERGLKSWRRQQEIEKTIQQARKELPMLLQGFSDWSAPNEWEVRAMSAARDAIAKLGASASLTEVRDAALQAGRRIATEYESEQGRIRDDQQRKRLASNKSFLVSIGTAEVESYLKKLHLNDDIFDEDLERKGEIERTVRNVLEARLTGGESFLEAQRIAREAVDAEVNA